MDKKLLTSKDGFRAIAQMTMDTRRFIRERLTQITKDEFAVYIQL